MYDTLHQFAYTPLHDSPFSIGLVFCVFIFHYACHFCICLCSLKLVSLHRLVPSCVWLPLIHIWAAFAHCLSMCYSMNACCHENIWFIYMVQWFSWFCPFKYWFMCELSYDSCMNCQLRSSECFLWDAYLVECFKLLCTKLILMIIGMLWTPSYSVLSLECHYPLLSSIHFFVIYKCYCCCPCLYLFCPCWIDCTVHFYVIYIYIYVIVFVHVLICSVHIGFTVTVYCLFCPYTCSVYWLSELCPLVVHLCLFNVHRVCFQGRTCVHVG